MTVETRLEPANVNVKEFDRMRTHSHDTRATSHKPARDTAASASRVEVAEEETS